MGKLESKVAVITGGATGIGLAAAKRFVEEGAFVFIFGRRQEALDAAVAELASATGASEEAVLEALEAGQGYRTASIDATDRNDETLASHIGGEDMTMGTVEDRQLLAPAVARLAPREQTILQLRFGQGLTQSEIAARVGISQMHVSRLLAASLERLRKSVGVTPDER